MSPGEWQGGHETVLPKCPLENAPHKALNSPQKRQISALEAGERHSILPEYRSILRAPENAPFGSRLDGGGPSLEPIRLSWQFPVTAKYTGKIALAEPALARPLRGKPHPTPLLRCLTKSQHSKEQGINWEMLRRSPPHPLKPTSAL